MREQRPRNRDQETEENRQQRDFRQVRTELERHRPANRTRHYDDDCKFGYVGKLSRLNETCARNESASMKFEWVNLLPDKPDILGLDLAPDKERCRILRENYNMGFSKNPYSMCPTEPIGAMTSAKELYKEEEEKFAFKSKACVATTEPLVSLKNDHNVIYNDQYSVLKSSAIINSNSRRAYYHGEYDIVRINAASNQDNYRPHENFRVSIVDSIVEKLEGSYSSHKVSDHDSGLDDQYNSVCRNSASDQDIYSPQNSFRASIVDPIVEKIEGSYSSNRVLDHCGGLDNQKLDVGNESHVMEQDRACSDSRSLYVSRGSQAMEQDGECSESRGLHVECGSEVNLDRGGLQVEKDYCFGRDGDLRLEMSNHDNVLPENVDRSKQMLIEEVTGIEESSRNLLGSGRIADVSMITHNSRHQNILYENEDRFQPMLVATGEPSKSIFEKGRVVDLSMITQRAEQKTSFCCISSNKVHSSGNVDEQKTSEDTRKLGDMKNLEFRETVDETVSQDLLPSPFLLGSTLDHLSDEPVRTSKIDIKKRLGPAPNIKERLGPVRSVKKHLGHSSRLTKPSCQVTEKLSITAKNSRMLMPQIKGHKENEHCRSDLDILHGGDSFEIKMRSSKNEPLEHLDEQFEQFVHNAFMKSVKVLNENRARKRKFTERGTSTLKCSVCGSFSKEFVDTWSLANHAFMTKTADLRAEHLGFHRALCVLMGWNYAANLKGGWNRQVLPDSEALALKQDLIIWPPVVFIHNSSIGNANPDKRMILSIEELMAIIRGMGFGQTITKVCHGKAANQSIMVVNFHGTFSGLQEAEYLHKLYAESKHGRAEIQQITSQSNYGVYKSWEADKVQSVLYGYLGIAEDLDKLDCSAKGRCFVKSKKKIQAIANAL